jgi:8-oxo-dGTP pyrophosphatase MutT (NUDIX family)
MTPENKILMVKGRATGKWSFPKGHKERSEGYLDCAVRETFEETGVELKEYRPTGYYKLSYGGYYCFDVPLEIPLNPSDMREVEEACWMHVADIPRKSVNVDVGHFLDRFHKMKRREEDEQQPTAMAA